MFVSTFTVVREVMTVVVVVTLALVMENEEDLNKTILKVTYC